MDQPETSALMFSKTFLFPALPFMAHAAPTFSFRKALFSSDLIVDFAANTRITQGIAVPEVQARKPGGGVDWKREVCGGTDWKRAADGRTDW
jgi:hypothetical protein